MIERRKFLRVLAFSSIRLFTDGRKCISDADLLDISMGGVCAGNVDRQVMETLSDGQELEFELMIDTCRVKGVAMIAWLNIEKLCLGLKFVEIYSDEERSSLESLINSSL